MADYEKALMYFAEKKGISVEELRARLGSYPAPDCLEPDEIEALWGDITVLSAARIDHFQKCDLCKAVAETIIGPIVISREEIEGRHRGGLHDRIYRK